MIQSIVFGAMLYLMPSVLLGALLMCREKPGLKPDELETSPSTLARGP
jgi:hypothetical protein